MECAADFWGFSDCEANFWDILPADFNPRTCTGCSVVIYKMTVKLIFEGFGGIQSVDIDPARMSPDGLWAVHYYFTTMVYIQSILLLQSRYNCFTTSLDSNEPGWLVGCSLLFYYYSLYPQYFTTAIYIQWLYYHRLHTHEPGLLVQERNATIHTYI